MEPVYPIFTVPADRPTVVIMGNTPLEAGDWEEYDIREGLYNRGWDLCGQPLKLIMDPVEGPRAVITDETPQIDDLRNAIFGYAESADPDVPFAYSGAADDVVALFQAAYAHVEAIETERRTHSWMGRIMNWINRR